MTGSPAGGRGSPNTGSASDAGSSRSPRVLTAPQRRRGPMLSRHTGVHRRPRRPRRPQPLVQVHRGAAARAGVRSAGADPGRDPGLARLPADRQADRRARRSMGLRGGPHWHARRCSRSPAARGPRCRSPSGGRPAARAPRLAALEVAREHAGVDQDHQAAESRADAALRQLRRVAEHDAARAVAFQQRVDRRLLIVGERGQSAIPERAVGLDQRQLLEIRAGTAAAGRSLASRSRRAARRSSGRPRSCRSRPARR